MTHPSLSNSSIIESKAIEIDISEEELFFYKLMITKKIQTYRFMN